MVPAVLEWRRIAAKYSDYEVYPYSDHSPFVDQVKIATFFFAFFLQNFLLLI